MGILNQSDSFLTACISLVHELDKPWSRRYPSCTNTRKGLIELCSPIGHNIQSIFCSHSGAGIRLNFGNGPVRVGTQGLLCPYLKTFVPPFLLTRLTAPGSPRMFESYSSFPLTFKISQKPYFLFWTVYRMVTQSEINKLSSQPLLKNLAISLILSLSALKSGNQTNKAFMTLMIHTTESDFEVQWVS